MNDYNADALASNDEVIDTPPVEFDTDPILDVPVEEVAPDPVPEPEDAPETRIGRAVQVLDGVVNNILTVVVDDDNSVVGFEVPYGQELVVVEDDSPVTFGWTYDSNAGEFTEPSE